MKSSLPHAIAGILCLIVGVGPFVVKVFNPTFTFSPYIVLIAVLGLLFLWEASTRRGR